MRKKTDDAPRCRSSSAMRSKLKFGSVPRTRWTGMPARPRISRQAVSADPGRSSRRPAPRRIPFRVHRQGMSTSWLRETAKRAPPQCRGSRPSFRRSRSSGGSSGSRHVADAGSGRARREAPLRSSIRARWKNASASSSPSGRSPRSTCSQAASRYGTSSPKPSSMRTERVEHPAGAPLYVRRDQRSAALTMRASCVTPGFGSPRENTGSTYGGRGKAGRSPASSVIAQRPRLPSVVTGAGGRPSRSW